MDFQRQYVEPLKEVRPGLDALRQWAVDQDLGAMAYDATRHVLVTLRGADLADSGPTGIGPAATARRQGSMSIGQRTTFLDWIRYLSNRFAVVNNSDIEKETG